MKRTKQNSLNRYVPPWVAGKTQLYYLAAGAAAAAFLSAASFWLRLDHQRSLIRDGATGQYDPGALMPSLIQLLSCESGMVISTTVFLPFLLLAVGAVLLAVQNLAGFYQGSRSIYLMKRLPDRWALPRRCLTAPLLLLLACLVLVPALTGLLWLLYLAVLPPQVIPPDNTLLFWENVSQLFYPIWSSGGGYG